MEVDKALACIAGEAAGRGKLIRLGREDVANARRRNVSTLWQQPHIP